MAGGGGAVCVSSKLNLFRNLPNLWGQALATLPGQALGACSDFSPACHRVRWPETHVPWRAQRPMPRSPHAHLRFQGKYILTPSPITYGEEQLLHFLGQLLGIAIRADVPLPLDLLPSFWKTLVGEPLDPEQDLQEADILTYNYVKKFESVSTRHSSSGGVQRPGPPRCLA